MYILLMKVDTVELETYLQIIPLCSYGPRRHTTLWTEVPWRHLGAPSANLET